MSTKKSLPPSARIIKTFEQLDRYIQAFVANLSLLILIGRAGIQKSTCVRKAIGENVCWLEGHVTTFGMYRQLYEHRNQLVVIDDVDSLYSDRNAVRLLKSLCQTESRKTIRWQSDSQRLERLDIPGSFQTTSRVAIIANDWRSLNENVLAIEDRGHVVVFNPDSWEVHERVRQWFDDEEIFEFIEQHLHMIERHSMRLYFKAAELKKAGMDWREEITNQLIKGRTRLVAELLADSSFDTDAERVASFAKMGGGTRSTFYEHAKRLRESGLFARNGSCS